MLRKSGGNIRENHSFHVLLFKFTTHPALKNVSCAHTSQIRVVVVTEYERIFLKDFPLMGVEFGAKPFPETHSGAGVKYSSDTLRERSRMSSFICSVVPVLQTSS